MVDIVGIGKVVGLVSSALAIVKQAADLIPEGPKKTAAETTLVLAERELKIAEAQVASKLEYELCRDHYPPVVMRSKDDENWKCPECENQKYTGLPALQPGYIQLDFIQH